VELLLRSNHFSGPDFTFVGKFAHALEHMGQYSPARAGAIAETLLPDMLPYDYARPAAYPESGRALSDDVFDIALSVYTQWRISDGVGRHSDLLTEFPYLGPTHRVQAEATGSRSVRRDAQLIHGVPERAH